MGKESPAMSKWMVRLFGVTLVGALTLAAQKTPKPDPEKKPDSAESKKTEAPKEKAFADVVKDAKVIKGLFTFYQTEDQAFLEILPEQLDKMYMLSLTCESGLGEGGFYAAANCGETPIAFHKHGKNVPLIATNTRFLPQEKSPMDRAMSHSFSDSILGATKLESLPHPERKSLLIDLGALLLPDVPMLGYELETSVRIPSHFDQNNSYFAALM